MLNLIYMRYFILSIQEIKIFSLIFSTFVVNILNILFRSMEIKRIYLIINYIYE